MRRLCVYAIHIYYVLCHSDGEILSESVDVICDRPFAVYYDVITWRGGRMRMIHI